MKFLEAAVLVLSLLSFPAFAAQVDINSADAKTLAAQLDGVGAKTAEEIVAYREKNGPFKSADDLLKIKGFGKKTLEKNRDRILIRAPAK